MLATGSRLGPYEIQSPLGAGGMGQVYRARDMRLDRIVAIKVLPEELASDPQFRVRFDREARTISQLDHPHICALYDVGQQDGTSFLVMQYLEGETLVDRLAKSALPMGEALTIAIQLAGALDAAHRAGITHRDLKPGNVMLTKAGAVRPGSPQSKLLDFGLAKIGAAGAGRATKAGRVGALDVAQGFSPANLTAAPTMGTPLTAQGTILGTFQYMAPEQIEGEDADARTDIFAFGALLYEMLAGKKAFTGKTQASLIGAILKDEPPAVSSVQPLAPASLDRVVRKCLEKDADNRWQTARDLLDELKWIAESGATAASATVAVGPAEAGRHVPGPAQAGRYTSAPAQRERLAWLLAAAALIVAILAVSTTMYLRRAVPEAIVTRLDVVTPPTTDPFSFALSSDGRQDGNWCSWQTPNADHNCGFDRSIRWPRGRSSGPTAQAFPSGRRTIARSGSLPTAS